MTAYYFVQPLDVLMLRGNKSFGDAGEHGEAQLPPWPSVFAGAFRSALLGQDATRLARFVAGQRLDGALGACLGTPAEPGHFRITWLSLAQARNQNTAAVVPLPADLLAYREGEQEALLALQPAPLPAGLNGTGALPMRALLRAGKQSKPVGGWLDQAGLAAHLAGKPVARMLKEDDLYARELRLGIALDAASRTAAEGALYTTEAVAFAPEAGFLVGIDGADDLLPAEGLLRLGGDGKAARYRRLGPAEWAPPAAPLADIDSRKRFRIVLATPGVFAGGWLPDGVRQTGDGAFRLEGSEFGARLACAAVPRHEVVSGWDLAAWRPKTAQRVAPAGSVYWFDQFEGDAGKLADWVAGGPWAENPDRQRQVEGFNLAWLAAWGTA